MKPDEDESHTEQTKAKGRKKKTHKPDKAFSIPLPEQELIELIAGLYKEFTPDYPELKEAFNPWWGAVEEYQANRETELKYWEKLSTLQKSILRLVKPLHVQQTNDTAFIVPEFGQKFYDFMAKLDFQYSPANPELKKLFKQWWSIADAYEDTKVAGSEYRDNLITVCKPILELVEPLQQQQIEVTKSTTAQKTDDIEAQITAARQELESLRLYYEELKLAHGNWKQLVGLVNAGYTLIMADEHPERRYIWLCNYSNGSIQRMNIYGAFESFQCYAGAEPDEVILEQYALENQVIQKALADGYIMKRLPTQMARVGEYGLASLTGHYAELIHPNYGKAGIPLEQSKITLGLGGADIQPKIATQKDIDDAVKQQQSDALRQYAERRSQLEQGNYRVITTLKTKDGNEALLMVYQGAIDRIADFAGTHPDYDANQLMAAYQDDYNERYPLDPNTPRYLCQKNELGIVYLYPDAESALQIVGQINQSSIITMTKKYLKSTKQGAATQNNEPGLASKIGNMLGFPGSFLNMRRGEGKDSYVSR